MVVVVSPSSGITGCLFLPNLIFLNTHQGIFIDSIVNVTAVNTCHPTWSGSNVIRQKRSAQCEFWCMSRLFMGCFLICYHFCIACVQPLVIHTQTVVCDCFFLQWFVFNCLFWSLNLLRVNICVRLYHVSTSLDTTLQVRFVLVLLACSHYRWWPLAYIFKRFIVTLDQSIDHVFMDYCIDGTSGYLWERSKLHWRVEIVSNQWIMWFALFQQTQARCFCTHFVYL